MEHDHAELKGPGVQFANCHTTPFCPAATTAKMLCMDREADVLQALPERTT